MMRRYVSLAFVAALGLVPLVASRGAEAANTGAPPPVGTGTGTSGGSSGGGSILPKPSLHYTFDGKTNNILGGHDLAPDRSDNLHFGFVAGKSGANPGAIEGLGRYQGDPHYFFPANAWTATFTIFPTDRWDGQRGCSDGYMFFDGEAFPLAGGAVDIIPDTAVLAHVCGPNRGNDGTITIALRVDNTAPADSVVRLTLPASTGTWHTVTVIYDWVGRKKLSLTVDGKETSAALPGPQHPTCKTGSGACLVDIGGPMDPKRGFDYGRMDDFLFYPSANWPLQLSTGTGATNRAQVQ